MVITDFYKCIIEDFVNGVNVQDWINKIYNDSKKMNDETVRLLSTPDEDITQDDINTMFALISISNILYNNTSQNVLPLEDGIYDLLVVKYKNVTGREIVGAVPFQIHADIQVKPKEQELVPGILYFDEKDNQYIDNMLYHDDLYKTKVFTPRDMLYPGVTYERIVSKRLRNTAHNNPELVGTLEKSKFVLMKQAIDKGVENDPTVNVLERDFFAKHIEMGIIDPRERLDIIAELKYDGVSIEANIFNKRIVSAISRGDTENDVASDLTPILEGYYFPDAPELNTIVPIKFEAIMTYDNLQRYCELKGRNFANGRTAIISWTTSSDAYQYRDLITLVPLATGLKDSDGGPLDRLVEVELMNKYYCKDQLLRYSVFSGDLTNVLFQIYRFAEEAEFMRSVLPFMYDGIVVSYLDYGIRQALGRKDSVNLYSMAVKFNPLSKETRFIEYKYTIGQNGEITPMIYYNPVEFFGTIHPKSSGHSYGNFKKQSLRPGDILEVVYRNDVMPYASKKECVENDRNPNPVIEFPTNCPCCDTPLVFTDKSAYCPNMACHERSIKRMANMMDKLQITGFAEERMRDLKVYSFHELMELKLEDVSYIGDLTSQSLIDQLNNLRNGNVFDWRLVGALGFTDLAANKWKLILQNISLHELVCAIENYHHCGDTRIINILQNIKGIGDVAIKTILNEYPYFIKDIYYILNDMKYQASQGIKPIKVRFTGVRDQKLVNILNEMGYDAGEGSVTKDTDILIVPSAGYNSGSKYNNAIKYGVKIIPIQDFINELGIES